MFLPVTKYAFKKTMHIQEIIIISMSYKIKYNL